MATVPFVKRIALLHSSLVSVSYETSRHIVNNQLGGGPKNGRRRALDIFASAVHVVENYRSFRPPTMHDCCQACPERMSPMQAALLRNACPIAAGLGGQ
jgi:hypothetical protein